MSISRPQIRNVTPHAAQSGRGDEHAPRAAGVFAQSSEPLKIGFLTVLTGPLAAGGKQQEEGAALFLKERNGMIAGRKVELITQDTAGNPALAKTKLQELVERSQGAGVDRPARHQRGAGDGQLCPARARCR